MSEGTQSNSLVKGILIGSSIPFIVGGLVTAIEVIAPPELSVVGAIFETFGNAQDREIRASADAQAMQETLLAFAQQEEQRRTLAEKELQEAKKIMLATAAQMEQQALNTQAEIIKNSMAGKTLGINIGDAACDLGKIIPDPLFQAGCDFADRQREDIAEQVRDTLQSNRSTIIEETIENLPTDKDWGIEERALSELIEALKNG
tara:strand:+ start:7298 stop:7909 length:612 start_codon:yes stop_codon:yes gene_type:complete